MSYPRTKIYHDGSHYIGIPETHRPKRPKKEVCKGKVSQADNNEKTENKKSAKPTLKEEFERLYKEYSNSPKTERNQKIVQELIPKFKDEESAKAFVENNIERMKRNRLEKLKRLMRKVRLQQWNYFLTFTYDNQKHNENSFKKGLTNCLNHLANRKGWKYIGVWERSPKNNRLHFHCIAYIPDGQMIGSIEKHSDYDTVSKRIQETYQNSHFLEKYGRNDFQEIIMQEMPYVISYLIKYVDKSGERLVYSRGLPTYFISDIFDDDIACFYGIDDRKLLLFDNFICMDEGEILGTVSPEVISKLPKAN